MKEKLNWLLDWVDERPIREQALILLLSIIVVYGFMNLFFLAPLEAQYERLQSDSKATQAQIERYNAESKQIVDNATRNTSGNTRKQHATLTSHVNLLNQQLNIFSSELLPSNQVAEFLTSLLNDKKGLSLLGLQNQPPQPITESTKVGEVTLYEHGLVIKFQGTFFATLAYLQEIAKLKWQLYWDALDYQVTQYPEATITLTLHTLNTEKGWISD